MSVSPRVVFLGHKFDFYVFEIIHGLMSEESSTQIENLASDEMNQSTTEDESDSRRQSS